MCICAFTLTHPDYALILCSNRDELLARPTASAHFHSFEKPSDQVRDNGIVLSGRDALAGGTWLGISKAGKLGLLTNITEPPSSYTSSRGHLISSFLLSNDLSIPVSANHAQQLYAGFNMLLLTPDRSLGNHLSYTGVFVSNGGAGGVVVTRPLTDEEKILGTFSNGVDGQGGGEWPKVCQLREATRHIFRKALECPKDAREDVLVSRLMECLTSRSVAPVRQRSELRNTVQVKPLSINLTTPGDASADSAAAQTSWYGTRVSTVVLVGRDGRVLFVERDIWKLQDGVPIEGDPREDRVHRFICLDTAK